MILSLLCALFGSRFLDFFIMSVLRILHLANVYQLKSRAWDEVYCGFLLIRGTVLQKKKMKCFACS